MPPLYFSRKETPASENPRQCLGHLTTEHAVLWELQWLQPCAKKSSPYSMETAREFNDQWRSMDIWYPDSLVFGSYILLIRVAPLDCHSIINLCHGTVAIYILLAGCIDRTDLSRSKSANNSKIALDLDLHGSTRVTWNVVVILHLARSTGNTAKLLSLAFQKWHCQSRIKAKSVSDQRLIFEVTGPQRESLMTCAGG